MTYIYIGISLAIIILLIYRSSVSRKRKLEAWGKKEQELFNKFIEKAEKIVIDLDKVELISNTALKRNDIRYTT